MILRNKRIFIIEDNLANRAIMQMALEFEGAKTAVERWGVDVMPTLAKFAPVDVILLDLMFPNNVTGYSVYEQIRAVPAFQYVPVVAVSATDPAVAIPRTQALGFGGFIRKPINQDKFPRQILAVINGETCWERI